MGLPIGQLETIFIVPQTKSKMPHSKIRTVETILTKVLQQQKNIKILHNILNSEDGILDLRYVRIQKIGQRFHD